MYNLHPLLDFITKFRQKIVDKFIEDKIVPVSANNWDLLYKHLQLAYKTKEIWSIIDDRAQELGLDYDDWLILKMKASEVNSYKHPTPILTKEEAYAKIESLKGTQYTNCYEPMKNLVNLFEKKQIRRIEDGILW